MLGWLARRLDPIDTDQIRGVKPADATNPEYPGLCEYGDKVLNYEGIEGSISRRLNVRGLFKRPRRSTPRSLPLSVLRERDREVEGGTYKLLTCGYPRAQSPDLDGEPYSRAHHRGGAGVWGCRARGGLY